MFCRITLSINASPCFAIPLIGNGSRIIALRLEKFWQLEWANFFTNKRPLNLNHERVTLLQYRPLFARTRFVSERQERSTHSAIVANLRLVFILVQRQQSKYVGNFVVIACRSLGQCTKLVHSSQRHSCYAKLLGRPASIQ